MSESPIKSLPRRIALINKIALREAAERASIMVLDLMDEDGRTLGLPVDIEATELLLLAFLEARTGARVRPSDVLPWHRRVGGKKP